MPSNWFVTTTIIVIAVHVVSLVVAVMAMLMVHRYDRSDAFKDLLVGAAAASFFLSLLGAVFVTYGLFEGFYGESKIA